MPAPPRANGAAALRRPPQPRSQQPELHQQPRGTRGDAAGHGHGGALYSVGAPPAAMHAAPAEPVGCHLAGLAANAHAAV
jgi:hypothetical protein